MREHECHKNPPMALDVEDQGWRGVWPRVKMGDWCGSYDFNKEAEKLLSTL
jgi:hypothetical protein